jgi:hypothetical protein
MADHPDALPELSDEEELQTANFLSILHPKDCRAIPSWMLSHYGSLPKRFDTHFFLASMPEGQEAAHDQLETTDGVWIRREDALARFERSEFPLVFATIHQLRALSGLASIATARERLTGVHPSSARASCGVRAATSSCCLTRSRSAYVPT